MSEVTKKLWMSFNLLKRQMHFHCCDCLLLPNQNQITKSMSLHISRKGSSEGNFELPILIASVILNLNQLLSLLS